MKQAEPIEVRREKVFIPDEMMPKEISKKYGLNITTASRAKKKVSS
jgi:hypothetical protein